MRNYFKNYPRGIILLFGALLIIYGCQKDESFIEEINENKTKFNLISFKEFAEDKSQNLDLLNKSMNILAISDNTLSRETEVIISSI
ncbi:hypothetical protein [Winogradskyella immobilis]|uniref:Uncharacterized protein n=1 Tax=Winogradskyella immobilis TaxID=2816852 RepID=A0ABS8EPC2_9FLAO|nr:hypothetical protein [Winogradskyella immobilis]MCC1484415.1 hypothetical protein [Winogradskyella immobilis]MCG0016507.1 hypothetical protein [Winogradskyella immobilis]